MFKYFSWPVGILVALASVAALFIVPRPSGDASLLPLLLSIAIAISGITVPLIIIYRTTASPNIRITIAQKIDAYFFGRGITTEVFLGACANARTDPGTAKGLLLILEQAYTAKDKMDSGAQRYAAFPNEVKDWLIESMQKKWFTFFFDARMDKPISSAYLICLVALSVLCFIDLYAHFIGLPKFWMIYVFDRGIVLATVAVNFAAYCVLGWFAFERSSLENHVDAALHKICPQVVPDIKRYQHNQTTKRKSVAKKLKGKTKIAGHGPGDLDG
jgi:hypothetical protein